MKTLAKVMRGVTLLELLIVITIIGLMACLILPAVQFSRESGRRVQCQSHLHQLGVAVETYAHFHRALPLPVEKGHIGGWAIAVLPFVEDGRLGEDLWNNPPLSSEVHRKLARGRPAVLTCPSGYDGECSEPPIEVSHYAAWFQEGERVEICNWTIGDVPLDATIPWAISPMNADYPWSQPEVRGPHSGGFNSISGTGRYAGAVVFRSGN